MGERYVVRESAGRERDKGGRYRVGATALERFWAKVDRRGDDECWPWLGATFGGGYGQLRVDGRNYRASRFAWELRHDAAFPDGMFACHSCDNPNCVNPAHIWPGTNGDNIKDAAIKKRHHRAKLTHCKWGHEFTEANTIMRNGSQRQCRACHSADMRAARARGRRSHKVVQP